MLNWLNLFYTLSYIYHEKESKSQGLSLAVIINHHFKLCHIHMIFNFLLDYQKFVLVFSQVISFKDRQKGERHTQKKSLFNCNQCSVLQISSFLCLWQSMTFLIFKKIIKTPQTTKQTHWLHIFSLFSLIIILLLYVHAQKSTLYVIP